MKRIIIAAAAIAAFAGAQDARAAGSTPANMAVSATVPTVCSLTTDPMVFGSVALGAVTDGTGTVNVTCTTGGAYTVALDNGLNASTTQRRLIFTANAVTTYLNYNLFSDTTRLVPWGATTTAVTGTGSGAEQALTVYGEIPTGQPMVAGNGVDYADTVTVTVSY